MTTSFYVYEWAKALAMSGLAAVLWAFTVSLATGFFQDEKPVEVKVEKKVK